MMRDKQAGFTLIETLVALVVFALVAAAVQQCLSGGWRGVRLVRMQTAALSVAKAELAAAGFETALVEGTQSGETADGFAWTRDVSRYQYHLRDDQEQTAAPGFWVTVSVRWREAPFRPERSLQLRTLKLGRRE